MVIFLAFVLGLPTFLLVRESIVDTDVRSALPHTVSLLADEITLPDQRVYLALAQDLAADSDPEVGRLARRLNVERPGSRTAVVAARTVVLSGPADPRAAIIAADARWAAPEIWQAIKAASGPLTSRYLLQAVDLERDAQGGIVRRNPELAIYRSIFIRTFAIAGAVTLICLTIGLPMALYAAALQRSIAERLLLLLMLPLWTSVLVRAMAWILLLQSHGLVNRVLLGLGVIAQPLELAFNRFAVIVAMTHVLLPFMVLPAYNALRTVPRAQLLAAGSLGASPWQCAWQVYLPQARAGIGAGCILVFASAAGYYVTPGLVGGPGDRMIGTFIEMAAIRTNNPGLAAGLGVVFLLLFLLAISVLLALLKPGSMQAGAHGR
jgi:putative spermidine/putrescine transport system permease protein